MPPETRFAHGPDGAVGYQVFGDGDVDLVFVTQWGTNIDTFWDEPSAARYLDRLATFSRVILLDKRGSGVSDPVDTPMPTIEEWSEDITTVLDAVESETAVIVGDVEGTCLAITYAALHPERVASLVLINGAARWKRADDYPEGMPPDVIEGTHAMFVATFGSDASALVTTAPSMVGDRRFERWWLKFQRSTMPPRYVSVGFRWILEQDVREAAKALDVPTLVIHRRDAFYHRIAAGRWLAANIEGAQFIEVPGGDTLPFHAGDFTEILDHVEAFVTGTTTNVVSDRRLATVLFTDIVGSTERAAELGDRRWTDLLAASEAISERQVRRFGGTSVATTGDGHLATFEIPMQAIEAARQLVHEVSTLGVDIRVGIHTGEISVVGDNIAGIGVHIASRVLDLAPDGGIAVSSTVRELTVGSSVRYDQLGVFPLKGVPGEWRLYQVV